MLAIVASVCSLGIVWLQLPPLTSRRSLCKCAHNPGRYRLTQQPPSRLVGVQYSLSLDVFQDAVVPGPEDLAHAVPCLDKAAFCHREMQVVVVDIQNLALRRPLQVMHHLRKADSPVPDLAVRQSVHHHWLHLFPAVRTPVPGEHMLGDRRLGILLEVLDDPGTT